MAALSYALAASSVGSKVPSHTPAACRGSRISAAHFPQGLCLSSLYLNLNFLLAPFSLAGVGTKTKQPSILQNRHASSGSKVMMVGQILFSCFPITWGAEFWWRGTKFSYWIGGLNRKTYVLGTRPRSCQLPGFDTWLCQTSETVYGVWATCVPSFQSGLWISKAILDKKWGENVYSNLGCQDSSNMRISNIDFKFKDAKHYLKTYVTI